MNLIKKYKMTLLGIALIIGSIISLPYFKGEDVSGIIFAILIGIIGIVNDFFYFGEGDD